MNSGLVEDTVKLILYTVIAGVIVTIVAGGVGDIREEYAKTMVEREIDQMMAEIRVANLIPGKEFICVVDIPQDVSKVDLVPYLNAGTLARVEMKSGMMFEKWYDRVIVIADTGDIPLRPLKGITVASGKSNLRVRIVEDPFSGKILSAISGSYPVIFKISDIDTERGFIWLVLEHPQNISLRNLSFELYINGERYPYQISTLVARKFDFSNHTGYQYIGGEAFSGKEWKRGEIGVINIKNGVISPGDTLTIYLLRNGVVVGKDEVKI